MLKPIYYIHSFLSPPDVSQPLLISRYRGCERREGVGRGGERRGGMGRGGVGRGGERRGGVGRGRSEYLRIIFLKNQDKPRL